MLQFKYPTKPREVVCFKPVELKTKEGKAFVFFAFDVYSKSLIALEGRLSPDLCQDEVRYAVRALMDHKEFSNQTNPFILVMDVAEDLEEELNLILQPFHGQVKFDIDFVETEMMPDLSLFFQGMKKG